MALSHYIGSKTEHVCDSESAKVGDEGTLGRGGKRENNHGGMDGHIKLNTAGTLLFQCFRLKRDDVREKRNTK